VKNEIRQSVSMSAEKGYCCGLRPTEEWHNSAAGCPTSWQQSNRTDKRYRRDNRLRCGAESFFGDIAPRSVEFRN